VTEFGADAQSILTRVAVNANFAMGSFVAILAHAGSQACENPALPASGGSFTSHLEYESRAVGALAMAHKARYA
jgi:hypothetical protein